jgi:FG-GAP-like repeat
LQLTTLCTNCASGVAPENTVICTHTFLTGGTNIAANNICITNLNIDCNGTFLTTNLNQGLRIAGLRLDVRTNAHVVGVNVYDATHPDRSTNDWTTETFIIDTLVPPGGVGSGHLIQNCSVRHFYNPTGFGKCSGITVNEDHGTNDPDSWVSATVEGNYVELNRTWSPDVGGEFAYNGLYIISTVYRKNTAKGAGRTFNNDTGYDIMTSWIDNTNHVPYQSYGYYMTEGTQWSRISGNTFYLYGPPPYQHSPASGLFVCGPTPAHPDGGGNWPTNTPIYTGSSNLLIDANIFLKVTNTDTASYAIDLHGIDGNNQGYWTIPYNVDVEKNHIQAGLNDHAPTNLTYILNCTHIDGTFSTNSPSGFPTQPLVNWVYTPYRCDFDQNGSIDLVLQDTGSSNVLSWAMNGTNVLSTNQLILPSPYQPGCNWRVVAVGDMDRDGRTDILWEDTVSTALAFWTMNRTSPSTNHIVLKSGGVVKWPDGSNAYLGASTKVCALADFNNDGHPDIVVEYSFTIGTNNYTYTGIWDMRDTALNGTNTWITSYGPGYPWHVVGTGDFDGDGKMDLLFQNSTNLVVWFMDNTTRRGDPAILPSLNSSAWSVVATGDFDHDGKVDIVVAESADQGQVSVWTMDGTTRLNVIPLTKRRSGFDIVGPR